MSLLDLQTGFFRSLADDSCETPELQGRMEIYRYAYFERIRASIEEDFPMLFEYLESVPGNFNAEVITRALLNEKHPHSWTLAEARLPVISILNDLLSGPEMANVRREAIRLARFDEAEGLANWLQEWPEPSMAKPEWVERFAMGELALARTKTWQEVEGRVYWRSENGVHEKNAGEFNRVLLSGLPTPMSFSDFTHFAAENACPTEISAFLQLGISEGWLRLTEF